MATLQDYLGITALRDAWPKWKANVVAVNNQVINHVAGSADKHAAQDITYTGVFAGKTEVKAALDQAKTEIDTIVVSASIDPEVAFARDSAVKSKVFGSLDARLEEDEQDLVSYKADNASLIAQSAINFKIQFGIKGDGSDEGVLIQSAIDSISSGRTIFIPHGTYKSNIGISFNKAISFIGEGAMSTVFDFTDMPSGAGVTFRGVAATRIVISGFNIKGNTNIDGLFLNGDVAAIGAVDSRFSDLLISNCNTGIKTTYSWTNMFENIRVSGGVNGLYAGHNTNNILFSRCSFGYMSGQALSAYMSESLQFSTCEFYDLSHTTLEAIKLFQSDITLINPYFENITSGILAKVGDPTEAIYDLSSLKISGGYVAPHSTIILGANQVNISIDSLKLSSSRIMIRNDDAYWVRRLSIYFTSTSYRTVAIRPANFYWGDQLISVKNHFSIDAGITQVQKKGFITLQTSIANAEIALTNVCVIGQSFVLALALRATGAVIKWNGKDGTLTPMQTPQLISAEFEVRYIPFIATSADLKIAIETIGVDVDIKHISVNAGSSPKEVDIEEPRQIYANSVPTSGSWRLGDYVKQATPVVGQPKGWYCTAYGTPGTWVSEGSL